MSAQIQDFVTDFPSDALATGLALVKGQTVTKRAALLAALNIESYVGGMFVDDAPVPMFSSLDEAMRAAIASDDSCPTKDEAIAAFEAVMPDDSGTMKAGIGKGQWMTILKTILDFWVGAYSVYPFDEVVMSQEITATSQLIYNDGVGSPFTLGGNTVIGDNAGAIFIWQKITVGTPEAAIPKGSVSTIGWAWFKNYDNTKSIVLRTASGIGNNFATVLPNSEFVLYMGLSISPYAISADGSVTMEYAFFNA